MRGITVKKPGNAEQLTISHLAIPEPNDQELLIKVEAAAVNRTDIINREQGNKHIKHPILGVEVSGVVEKAGENTNIKVGTRVMGLVNGGGYAEYALMPANRAMIIPDHLSFEEAAAIPEVFLTAYQTLFWIGNLKEKETVLIHAGGSGVGTAAIQLAKQLRNAQVITTAGSEKKLEVCQSLGADLGINYKTHNFDTEVLNATHQMGVDLILDFIGASYWDKNLKSVKTDGRWVLIGLLGGNIVREVDLMNLLSKRVQLTGTLLTPRSDDYKTKLTSEFINSTSSLFNERKLIPVIDKVFPLENVKEAHEYMESNQNIGKIILKVD